MQSKPAPIPSAARPAGTTQACGVPWCVRQCQLGTYLCGVCWKRCPCELQDRIKAAYANFHKNPNTANQRELRDVQFAIVQHFKMDRARRE